MNQNNKKEAREESRGEMWRILSSDLIYMKRWVELVSHLSDFETRTVDKENEAKVEEVIQLVLLKIEETSKRIREIRKKLNENNTNN